MVSFQKNKIKNNNKTCAVVFSQRHMYLCCEWLVIVFCMMLQTRSGVVAFRNRPLWHRIITSSSSSSVGRVVVQSHSSCLTRRSSFSSLTPIFGTSFNSYDVSERVKLENGDTGKVVDKSHGWYSISIDGSDEVGFYFCFLALITLFLSQFIPYPFHIQHTASHLF
jgi:hypothetical protein